MKIISIVLAFAFLISCVGCSNDVSNVDYTYTPTYMTWATPPYSSVLCCSSFHQIKNAFDQAVIDEISFDAYRNQIFDIPGWSYLEMQSRDEFLTMYDMLKDVTILVPKDGVIVKRAGVEVEVEYDIHNERYNLEINLSYVTPLGRRADMTFGTNFSETPYSDIYPYTWRDLEDAVPMYHGAGFDAYTKTHVDGKGELSKTAHLTVDGVDIGFCSGFWNKPFLVIVYPENEQKYPLTSEEVAAFFDCFEVANFHEVVQNAK